MFPRSMSLQEVRMSCRLVSSSTNVTLVDVAMFRSAVILL